MRLRRTGGCGWDTYWGVDLGTTFTAAAVWRDGLARMVNLGANRAAVPSVVFLREDETVLTGDAAVRRARTEPHRAAREFKRRLGDTTPILLAGSPYSAEALMSRVLRAVIEQVAEREGGPPDAVTVTHPANWGDFKIDLLGQAIRIAEVGAPVTLLSEPEAAAIFYASHERMAIGDVVAVFDLGGGTFDAAVLRRTAESFEILGEPEGIERLGGIDFDAAVYGHVTDALGEAFDALDLSDDAVATAVAQLRADCVEAKEALSSDLDTVVPVGLPDLHTTVRLTRPEFEGMIRPSLADAIASLDRGLRSAAVEPDDVSAVLLVGGSSRIPLVSQLVGEEFRRPSGRGRRRPESTPSRSAPPTPRAASSPRRNHRSPNPNQSPSRNPLHPSPPTGSTPHQKSRSHLRIAASG